MRVLYFMNHVDQGGAALALLDLLRELKHYDNIECVVITGKKNKLNDALDILGVENYSASFKNFMSSYKTPVFIYKPLLMARYKVSQKRAIDQIEEFVDIKSFDIIHSNLNRIDIGALLSKKYGIPHIWHIREHGELDFKLMSVKREPIKYMNGFRSEYVVISNSVREIWTSRGLDSKSMHLIYDGIRTELYLKELPQKVKGEKIKMIFLGGYNVSKGQEELIDALALLKREYLKKIQVDFYGNGNGKYLKYLKKKLLKYGLENSVHLYPYDNEVWKKTPQYDIGFTCSNAEAFGRVTVEYMMSGLCPIVSNTGANQELVKDGVTGFVYQKGNIKELKSKIEYLICNSGLIATIAQNAQSNSIDQFSMKMHAEQLVGLYNKIIL